jgi:hypothetical protein
MNNKMDIIIKSLSNLSVEDKVVVDKVVNKSESIDELVNSFQNLVVSEEKISEECKEVIINLIDVFKILSKKERCFNKVNYENSKWIF